MNDRKKEYSMTPPEGTVVLPDGTVADALDPEEAEVVAVLEDGTPVFWGDEGTLSPEDLKSLFGPDVTLSPEELKELYGGETTPFPENWEVLYGAKK